jgi:hypothetical protein
MLGAASLRGGGLSVQKLLFIGMRRTLALFKAFPSET